MAKKQNGPLSVIVRQNDLTNYVEDMGIIGSKMYRYAMSQIMPGDTEFHPITLTTAELAKVIGVSRSSLSAYASEFKEYIETRDEKLADTYFNQLSKATLQYSGKAKEDGWQVLTVFSYIAFQDGRFTFELNPRFSKFLLNINWQNGNYFKTTYEDCNSLTSPSACVLYDILIKQHYRSGQNTMYAQGLQLAEDEVVFTLDYLKALLDPGGKTSSHFMYCRIQRNVEEINKKTSLNVEYRTHSTLGNKTITHVVFRYLKVPNLPKWENYENKKAQNRDVLTLNDQITADFENQIEIGIIREIYTAEKRYENLKRLDGLVSAYSNILLQTAPLESGVFPDTSFSISGQIYDAKYVYGLIKRLNCENIMNIINNLSEYRSPIKNPTSYLITVAINELSNGEFQTSFLLF